MDIKIIVSFIALFSSILVAIVTFFLNRQREAENNWREYKVNYYREFLLSLSKLANRPSLEDLDKFSETINTISLFASQNVIEEINDFRGLVTVEKTTLSAEEFSDRHDVMINKIMLAIRKDIGVKPADNAQTFDFRLMGSNT